LLGQRQTKTLPALAARARHNMLAEMVEDSRQKLRGNTLPVIANLAATRPPQMAIQLPASSDLKIASSLPTLIYNYYNLDPYWKNDVAANRVLLLEPTVFDKYPVVEKCLAFALRVARENISGIQIFTGEFDELKRCVGGGEMYYKEHPLNTNYHGIEEPRDWMFKVEPRGKSFFNYWKQCRKTLN
jgi:deoxyribodipyrimidine photo-lyase